MTREEFAEVCAYLAAAVGKPMLRPQAEVYYDLLGDLPAAALRAAARQALCESIYPTLPPIGVLRKLATDALAEGALPPAAEAYRLVLRVVNARHGERGRLLEALPVPVRQAALAMGLESIGDSTEPEICRAQFTRVYEVYCRRLERQQLLPPALAEEIARLRDDLVKRMALPPPA